MNQKNKKSNVTQAIILAWISFTAALFFAHLGFIGVADVYWAGGTVMLTTLNKYL